MSNQKQPQVETKLSEVSYKFEFEEGKLVIREVSSIDEVALQSNASYATKAYYNNTIELVSIKFRLSDRKHKPTKICGHVPSGEFFYSDMQQCLFLTRIPGKGDELNVRQERVYRDPRYLTRVFLHSSYKTHVRTVSFEIPEGLNVRFIPVNFKGYQVEKTEHTSDKGRVVRYELKNLKAITEDASTTMFRGLPHVMPIVESYIDVSGENQKVIPDLTSLYQWYSTLASTDSRADPAISQLTDSLVSGLPSDQAKIQAIYYWVQSNIRYVAFEDGIAAFKPEAAPTVFENRYGDCKGMANLLKSMLTYAGYDARLSWLGTRRLPYTYDIPSLGVDNHMICTVFSDGDTLFLDATEEFQEMGRNGQRIQGKQVMVEDGSTYIIKEIADEGNVRSGIYNYLTVMVAQDKILGRGELVLSGEQKKGLRYLLGLTENKYQEELLSVIMSQDLVDNMSLDSVGDFVRDEDFRVYYSFEDKQGLSAFGDELYVNVPHFKLLFSLEKIDKAAWFLQDLGYKMFLETQIDFKLSSGMVATYRPQEFEISGDHFSFRRELSSEENLQVRYRYDIHDNYLPSALAEYWNTSLDQIMQYEKETFIFTNQDK